MKQITRFIVGAAGMAGVSTFFGTVGGTVMKKAAETYCKTPLGQLAVYSISSVGYITLIYPIIKNTSERIVDWIYEPECNEFVEEVNKRYAELLKKQEEES